MKLGSLSAQTDGRTDRCITAQMPTEDHFCVQKLILPRLLPDALPECQNEAYRIIQLHALRTELHQESLHA
jgi:hypothetical protein